MSSLNNKFTKMLEPYNPSLKQKDSGLSRPNNSYSNYNSYPTDIRPRDSPHARSRSNFPVRTAHNVLSSITEDMFVGMRDAHMSVFKEFENFHKKLFKDFNKMLGGDFFRDFESIPEISSHGPGRTISKTYVCSTKLDPQGKKYTEKYFSNDYAVRGSDEKNDAGKVSERHEAYQNTANNLQKIAEERRINNQAKKLVQQKIKGQEGVTRDIHFQNMNERDVNRFDQDWDFFTKKFRFYDMGERMLGHSSHDMQYVHPGRDHGSSYQREYDYGRNSQMGSRNGGPNNLRNHYVDQNFGRVRRNDIQPTQPSGRLALPGEHENIPRSREQNTRNERQNFEQAPDNAFEQHHEQIAPNVNNNQRRNPNIVRGDGNFRNRNVQNTMPQAS